jgi:hypothetical protein
MQLFLRRKFLINNGALTAEFCNRLSGIKFEDSDGFIATLFNANIATAYFILTEMRLEDDHEYWVKRAWKVAVLECFKLVTSYSSGRIGQIQESSSVRRASQD